MAYLNYIIVKLILLNRVPAEPIPLGRRTPSQAKDIVKIRGAPLTNRLFIRAGFEGTETTDLIGSIQERLTWYRGRLAAMSREEILHRLKEVTSKQVGRYRRGWQSYEPVGSLIPLPGLAARVRASPPDLASLVAREADDVRAGHFHLLGACWPTPPRMPPPPDFWHIDPTDGALFPQRDAYCFDLSFRHGVNTREIKRIWELNRLQFIVPLAADSVIKNDRSAADLALGLIRSWMEANPPFRGLSWIFGIELALRVISVALILSMVGIDRLDTATRREVLRFFFVHIDWIRRFPSLHSSANNHRIAELAGLVVATTVAPGFPRSAAIRDKSWRELLVQIDRQIYPDGVGAEQSPGYTAFSIEMFLVAAVACGRERNLEAGVRNRLSNWAEHSQWLMDAAARVPAIGDFDDCRAIATTQEPEPRYVASIVAAVAACVGRPDLVPPARDPSIRDVIFGSAQSAPIHLAGTRTFPIGGYSVIRRAVGTPAVLTFDHGPVGYLSIAAHGHADALAIWLSVGNQPVIVDAGTYLYHSNRTFRDAFRATGSHNTLTMGVIGSSCPSGPFNWATQAQSRLVSSESHPVPRIVAEHDGFFSRSGLTHRRTVEFDGLSRFTIVDELLGASPDKNATISFLLDPACKATLQPDGHSVLISVNDYSIAHLISAGGVNVRIVRGAVSLSFGVRVESDQILLAGNLDSLSKITIDVF